MGDISVAGALRHANMQALPGETRYALLSRAGHPRIRPPWVLEIQN